MIGGACSMHGRNALQPFHQESWRDQNWNDLGLDMRINLNGSWRNKMCVNFIWWVLKGSNEPWIPYKMDYLHGELCECWLLRDSVPWNSLHGTATKTEWMESYDKTRNIPFLGSCFTVQANPNTAPLFVHWSLWK